jgi:hypothetical protein
MIIEHDVCNLVTVELPEAEPTQPGQLVYDLISTQKNKLGVVISIDVVKRLAIVLWEDNIVEHDLMKHLAKQIRDEIDADIFRELDDYAANT